MDTKTAAEICGYVNPKHCGQADYPMTAEERALAIEVAGEMAARHGIDLGTLTAENEQEQRAAGRAAGYTDAEIDRMWAGK